MFFHQGVVYAYVNACPGLPIPHSDRDRNNPCFTTTGMQCTFKCDDGFIATDTSAIELAAQVVTFPIDIPVAYASISCLGDTQMRAAWVTIPAEDHCMQVSCPRNSSPRPIVQLGGDITGNECICNEGFVGATMAVQLVF